MANEKISWVQGLCVCIPRWLGAQMCSLTSADTGKRQLFEGIYGCAGEPASLHLGARVLAAAQAFTLWYWILKIKPTTDSAPHCKILLLACCLIFFSIAFDPELAATAR